MRDMTLVKPRNVNIINNKSVTTFTCNNSEISLFCRELRHLFYILNHSFRTHYVMAWSGLDASTFNYDMSTLITTMGTIRYKENIIKLINLLKKRNLSLWIETISIRRTLILCGEIYLFQFNTLYNPVDKRVKERVRKMLLMGITQRLEMHRHINIFVEENFPLVSKLDTSFHPTD